MSSVPTEVKVSTQNRVDIVILLDDTGSTASCLQAVTDCADRFIECLVASGDANGGTIDWRAKAVGYRDYTVDSDYLEDHDFVTTAAELKAQLSTLEARGGGDEPESLLDALRDVICAPASDRGVVEPGSWRHSKEAHRALIVMTDASFHPEYADGSGGTVDDVMNLIENKHILLYLVAPVNPDYLTLASVDKSEFYKLDSSKDPQTALRDFAESAEFKEMIKAIADSISSSI